MVVNEIAAVGIKRILNGNLERRVLATMRQEKPTTAWFGYRVCVIYQQKWSMSVALRYTNTPGLGLGTLHHCTDVHEPVSISLIGNNELITTPVFITPIRKVPSDDDGNLPAPF